jgi:C-terminal processing protease CtpA/Prc
MIRLGTVWLLAGLVAILVGPPGLDAQTTNEPLDFKEVYDLVREHGGGITEADLNRAAVKGLMQELGPRVSLVTNKAAASRPTVAPVVKSNLFEGDIAYVRIARVEPGLAEAVRSACQEVQGTNKLGGVVLDLRYSDGDDYQAAADTVDLFLRKAQPLLNWGNGTVQSKAKSDAITVPIAALVNHFTGGAAEALAAAIRQTGVGLILGSRTAGQAMVSKEFPLRNGQRLRIATARIEVGDTATLSPDGLKPDIDVRVGSEDERTYYADAFKVIPRQGFAQNSLSSTNPAATTNRASRRRFNEAELVRERKEGASFDLEANDSDTEPDKPIVHDPALARALDLLKGLAVVRHSAS